MLKVNNITKQYDGKYILKNISLNVTQHQIIGLAGPSGSGKSTLLRCINGLESIDSGVIECNEKIGFMFQDFQLFPHMSVIENLTYAAKLNQLKFNVVNKAEDLLKKLGILDKAKNYPCQLSGGQKQRVALARSLMMQPTILLCDEPTSGLDIVSIKEVVALLRNVAAMNLTLIIASHDLNFLANLANNIVLLKNGKIVTSINPNDNHDVITHLTKFYSN